MFYFKRIKWTKWDKRKGLKLCFKTFVKCSQLILIILLRKILLAHKHSLYPTSGGASKYVKERNRHLDYKLYFLAKTSLFTMSELFISQTPYTTTRWSWKIILKHTYSSIRKAKLKVFATKNRSESNYYPTIFC